MVNQKTTYDEEGKQVIKVKAGADGLTKRQATMELTFAAGRAVEEQPLPGIVFRGQEKVPRAAGANATTQNNPNPGLQPKPATWLRGSALGCIQVMG